MIIGFVLGNGTSRKNINLDELKEKGLIYGCNALYRDYIPDVLVATDKLISAEIQKIGYSKKHRFYTRMPEEGKGAHPVPAQYYGFSSGPIAVALAAQYCDVIFMLGFDFGSVDGGRFNNVYADTPFYKKSTDPATPGENWIKQITKIAADYPETSFVRVVTNDSKFVELNHIKNLDTLPLKSFSKLLNTL